MAAISMGSFEAGGAPAVRTLFIAVKSLLAPAGMGTAFADSVERCLPEEIDRVADDYGERGRGFWAAVRDDAPGVVGMFGLEPAPPDGMELRRMYVHPSARRAGVATAMLGFAEADCRRRGVTRMLLSTSELQPAAVALYRAAGYRETGTTVEQESSNRTVGGGIRRFAFERPLTRPA